jgi:hypothetical protein
VTTEPLQRSAASPVATALRLALMATSLAILALPALDMVVSVLPQKPLFGVIEESPCPRPSLASLANETLQVGFTRYFDQHYGARPWATRLDNSLALWVFGEMPPDKAVRIGSNDVLYISDQVSFYNRADKPDASAMAAKLKRAQDILLAQGKVFVFMIMPTKTTLWPEDVPNEWKRPNAAQSVPESNITGPYVEALRAAGARFVDGRATLVNAKLPREAAYSKTGRHLAGPAACLIYSEALALARPLVHDAEVPEIECDYHMAHDVALEEEEFDLYMLLNAWTPLPKNAIPVMNPMNERVPKERRADAVVVGTSFGWKVVHEAERTHSLRHLSYYYYDSALIDPAANTEKKVNPRSKEWQDLIASSTLIFYPAPEEYLLVDGEPFVDSVIAVYGEGKVAP